MTQPKVNQTKAFFKILNEDLKFENSAEISSTKIQRLFENPLTAPFLTNFIQTVTKENVLTPQQIESYNQLLEQGKVKSGLELERSTQKVETHISDCKTRKVELDAEIQKAQRKKKRLEYELAKMERLQQDQKQRLDKVNELASESMHSLRDEKNETMAVSDQVSKTISDSSVIFQKLCNIVENYDSNCHLLSQVQLQDLLKAEEAYNSALTSYVKKQFFEISQTIANDLNEAPDVHEIRTLADGDLFSEENEETRKKLAADLKRVELWYPDHEQMLISAQANESGAHAAISFLQEKRAKLSDNTAIETTEELRNSLVESREKAEQVQIEIAQLRKQKIPDLISQSTPLQTPCLLTGDYHRKLVRQEYFIEKQKKVVSLLQLQRDRLDLLWMLLTVEEVKHEKTGNQIPLFLRELQSMLHESIAETEWFKAFQEDTKPSVPKSVFDDKDKVAVDIYKVLGKKNEDRGNDSDPFYHFDGLPLMAESLQNKLTAIRKNVSANPIQDEARSDELSASTRNCESLLLTKNNDGRGDAKQVCLTPDVVNEMTTQLRKEFNHLSGLLSNSSKEIDMKKNFLQYNERAAASRTVWVDFYLHPNKLLKFCEN